MLQRSLCNNTSDSRVYNSRNFIARAWVPTRAWVPARAWVETRAWKPITVGLTTEETPAIAWMPTTSWTDGQLQDHGRR
jgi:hypothetical protein